jgi:hypothetical protein
VLFRRLTLAAVVLASASISASVVVPADGAGGVLLAEDFTSYPAGAPWREGEEHGPWRVKYTGYGQITSAGVKSPYLSMAVAAATSADETHGGLVTTREQFTGLDVTTRMWTIEQLRPVGNTWEVPWLVWHYTDDEHFYYLVLKPNGWELGKEDPAYPGAQRFLATSSMPSFPVGDKHTVRVRHVGNEITVWGDGTLLTTYVDLERPYRRGSVGLYTEDAHVGFDVVIVRRPQPVR